MDDEHKALLASLHALEDAERERADLMRKQHALIGQMLRADSDDEFDDLVWQRARVGESVAQAELRVRAQTARLLEAVEALRARR